MIKMLPFVGLGTTFFFLVGCGRSGSTSLSVSVKDFSAGTALSIAKLGEFVGFRGVAGEYGSAAVGSSGLTSYKLNIQESNFVKALLRVARRTLIKLAALPFLLTRPEHTLTFCQQQIELL